MAYLGGSVTKLDTAIRDVPTGAIYVDTEDQLATYQARFHNVKAMALEPEQSRDLIRRMVKGL